MRASVRVAPLAALQWPRTMQKCAIRGLVSRILERCLSARRALQRRRYGQIVRPNVDIGTKYASIAVFARQTVAAAGRSTILQLHMNFLAVRLRHSVCECWGALPTLLESACHADVDVGCVGGFDVERIVDGCRRHQERRFHVTALQGGT